MEAFLLKILRYDWLQVHDGNNDSAPLLGSKLCGNQIPEPLTSSGHEMFLKFHSDRTTEGFGYKMVADISDGSKLLSVSKIFKYD